MTTIEFLNSVKPDNGFVSETAQSFYEQSLYLAEAIQLAYNETFQGIGLEELGMLSESTDILTEADDNDPKEKKRILDWIKGLWAKIWGAVKGFFNNLITTIKAYFGKYKKNHQTLLSEAFKFFNTYEGKELSFGKVYEARLNPDTVSNRFKDDIGLIEKSVKGVYDVMAKFDFKNDTKATISNLTGLSTTKKDLFEKLGIGSKKGLRDGIKEKYTKGVDLKEVTSSNIGTQKDNISKYAYNEKGWLDAIKKQYNDMKKFVDGLLNDAKKLVNTTPAVAKEFANCAKSYSIWATQLVGATNDTIKEIISKINMTSNRIIVAYLKASGKKVKDVLGEATEPEEVKGAEGELVSDKDVSDDLLDESVEAAFDWL